MQSRSNINVYDFDGTIYNGDSSVDFFMFALKKKKRILLLFPKLLIYFILYFVGIIKKEKFKTVAFSFLKYFDKPSELIDEFWNLNEHKINPKLKQLIENDDLAIIVSASPEFLIKPAGDRLSIKKVICSPVDIKTGKWLGNNCSGINKIKYLDKNYNDYTINNSYSDSYSDRFVANNSKKAYMINKGEIFEYDENKLYMNISKKKGTILASIFFIIYFILGMLINYNRDIIYNYDFLFQSDTGRVYNDFISITGVHDRISVHPLFLLFQPFILLIQGITHNSVIAVVIFQAFIGSLCIKYLYQSLSIFSDKKLLNLILILIYGFSFSSIIFHSTFETYSLSALSFILFWYNIFIDFKFSKKINIFKYVGLGILTTGILLTNYTVFLVGIFILLISKKINIKNFICLNFITLISIVALSFVQEYIWVNAPNIIKSFTSSVEHEKDEYTSFDLSVSKVKNVVDDVFLNGIVAKDIEVKKIPQNKHLTIIFKNKYLIKDSIFIIFYFILFYLIIKNFKLNKIINLGLLISVIGMSLMHVFYGNENTFLYSQNILYLIILLFGINYQKKNKFTEIFLVIFLIIEMVSNVIVFRQLLLLLNKYFKFMSVVKKINIYKNIIKYGILISITVILVFLIYILIKKYFEKSKSSLLIGSICCFAIISCMFIKFQTMDTVKVNTKSTVKNSEKLVLTNTDSVFEEKYEDDVLAYQKYEKQYKKFVNQKNIELINNYKGEKIFFFGMGNRKKYVYRNGVLRDAENEKVYKRFDVDKELIIPNKYTVLIKTKEGKFYKIVEDKDAVKIIGEDSNNILPDTDIKMKLASFDKYEYSEILSVLYQEILFNIKDGVIYPNIFVYDDVWYRDSAMGAMVLEKTGNIDLISDWILSIDSIYDKSNGEEENDNLGELLYLLSLVTDKDNEMVKKVIDKADKIKIQDENGKYISNRTDFSNRPDYQTDWLNFGLSKFDIDLDYNYKKTDGYSNLLWFTNQETDNLEIYKFKKEYPYRGYAQRHLMGEDAPIYVSNQLYPLSWENSATRADYSKLTVLSDYFVNNRIGPTHVWSAAELFLLLEEE